jgi:hypothetical protein
MVDINPRILKIFSDELPFKGETSVLSRRKAPRGAHVSINWSKGSKYHFGSSVSAANAS